MKLKPGLKARGTWRPELGFMVSARCEPALDGRARKRLAERFVAEAVEGNGLVCGGGVFGPGARGTELSVLVVSEREHESCTKRDRGRVQRWLGSARGIAEHRVGALTCAGSDHELQERRRPPRARGANDAERAARLRQRAIAAYREAVEVLGTPEVREAVRRLERSAELAEASVDVVGKTLYRKLGLWKRSQTQHRRLWDLQTFLQYDLPAAARPRRRRRRGSFPPWTNLTKALFCVADLDRQELGVIDIPDMHEFERKLVWGSRVATDEVQKLLRAPLRSPTATQLARAASVRRQQEKQKNLRWPAWVGRIEDHALSEAVREAMLERDRAERWGAEKHRRGRAALKSGQKALDEVRRRRVKGQAALKKAADATREFTKAGDHASRKVMGR